jgi:hypothetical protein
VTCVSITCKECLHWQKPCDPPSNGAASEVGRKEASGYRLLPFFQLSRELSLKDAERKKRSSQSFDLARGRAALRSSEERSIARVRSTDVPTRRVVFL